MKDSALEKLLSSGEVKLGPKESAHDLEAMYHIILERRGKAPESATAFDTHLALASLCKFAWPGKLPSYKSAMTAYKQAFRGIAASARLQDAFRERIKEPLSAAQTFADVVLTRPSAVFEPAPPRARERTKSAARKRAKSKRS